MGTAAAINTWIRVNLDSSLFGSFQSTFWVDLRLEIWLEAFGTSSSLKVNLERRLHRHVKFVTIHVQCPVPTVMVRATTSPMATRSSVQRAKVEVSSFVVPVLAATMRIQMIFKQ
jgi:hypothetical protein